MEKKSVIVIILLGVVVVSIVGAFFLFGTWSVTGNVVTEYSFTHLSWPDYNIVMSETRNGKYKCVDNDARKGFVGSVHVASSVTRITPRGSKEYQDYCIGRRKGEGREKVAERICNDKGGYATASEGKWRGFSRGVTCGKYCINGACYKGCEENWKCGDWGSCENGQQNRMCEDENKCSTLFLKRSENRFCEESIRCDPVKVINHGEICYVVELISATDSSTRIKVTECGRGTSDSKEMSEATSKVFFNRKYNNPTFEVIGADERSWDIISKIRMGMDDITIREGNPVIFEFDGRKYMIELEKIEDFETSATFIVKPENSIADRDEIVVLTTKTIDGLDIGLLSVDLAKKSAKIRVFERVLTRMCGGISPVDVTSEACGGIDINYDEYINSEDVKIISENWLEENCDEKSDWCSGADIDKNGKVDKVDQNLVLDNLNRVCEEFVPGTWAMI